MRALNVFLGLLNLHGGTLQRGIQRPGELDVEGVAGLAGVDMAGQGPPQQREVSDQVHDLVADELVAEAEGSRDDPGVIEHDGVVEAPAAGDRYRRPGGDRTGA